MKKIININRRPIMLDMDNEEAKKIPGTSRGIDGVYVIPEDARVIWTDQDDNKIVRDVAEGDIMVTFYDSEFGTDFIIVKSAEWLTALKAASDAEQKRKEEWAAKRKSECGSSTDR